MMSGLRPVLAAGLVTTSTVLVGCLLASWWLQLGGVTGRRRLWFALGLGPGVGLGLLSLLLFTGRAFGLAPLSPIAAIGLVIALAAATWVTARGGLATPSAEPAANTTTTAAKVAIAVALLTLAATAVMTAAAFWTTSHAWPTGTWDAVAIWNARAQLLLHGYETAPTLLRQVEISSHPHYPLLLPGAVAAQQFLTGENLWVPRLTAMAFTTAVGFLLFAVVRDGRSLTLALAAPAVLLANPMVLTWGGAQVADIPLAYFLLGALGVVSSLLPGRETTRLPPVLGGLFLGLLAWTKNEGVVIAGLIVGSYVVWVLCGDRQWRRRWPEALGLVGGMAPSLFALLTLKLRWLTDSGLGTFLQGDAKARLLSLERWWPPIREIALRWIPLEPRNNWAAIWPMLLAGALIVFWLQIRRSRAWAWQWASVLVAVTAFWVVTYVVTPNDQKWHLDSSLDRLFLQVLPVVIAGLFLRLGEELSKPDAVSFAPPQPLP